MNSYEIHGYTKHYPHCAGVWDISNRQWIVHKLENYDMDNSSIDNFEQIQEELKYAQEDEDMIAVHIIQTEFEEIINSDVSTGKEWVPISSHRLE